MSTEQWRWTWRRDKEEALTTERTYEKPLETYYLVGFIFKASNLCVSSCAYLFICVPRRCRFRLLSKEDLASLGVDL